MVAMLSNLLTTAFVLPGLRPAGRHAPIAMSELWQQRGFGGPLPEGILVEDQAAALLPMNADASVTMTRAEVVAAVCGIVVCALAGSAVSAGQTDQVIAMLGAADLYNRNVLYTDLLVKGVDMANAAGLVVLPVAIAYAISRTSAAADADAEEDWVCVLGEIADEICGPASFDSTDAMTCVEDYSTGKFRWVCS
eukprot:CAMPEP_0119313304 /NCGR_PEP_ID=MMETSP1333-20130426/28651_1 /TAXON_ID=418940 /ORGANISM="Scyphosphaera apsteinii, Strain RCC1455" /LENGTH=193 /DNA_ID=CAMNT_0007318111 /DNA_START=32 /DNA_END=613 /DNA_ORIENTATION=-